MREIEKACLARTAGDFFLQPVECAAEVGLDAPAARGEPAGDQRENAAQARMDSALAIASARSRLMSGLCRIPVTPAACAAALRFAPR